MLIYRWKIDAPSRESDGRWYFTEIPQDLKGWILYRTEVASLDLTNLDPNIGLARQVFFDVSPITYQRFPVRPYK